MIKSKFLIFHSCILLTCTVVFFLFNHTFPQVINLNLGIMSLVFMSLIHIISGFFMIGLGARNEKKRIITAIAIHSTKFILVIFFVLILLSIEKNNYGLGIMLASLFLVYMISEILVFLYIQKQREIDSLK